MKRFLVALLVLVASCSSPARPRLAVATGPLTRRATIHHEIAGRPFALPLVYGTVRGYPVRMLIDTGANSHFVAGWLARRLGIPLKEAGDVGIDHVGRPVATFRIQRPEIAIDGWGKLAPPVVLATEVPELMERLGIGVFVSPQRLDEEGDAVVLDFAHRELRAARWDELELPEVRDATACEDKGAVPGLAFVVPATVEGQSLRLLLDTGAPRTDVFFSASRVLTDRSVPSKEALWSAAGRIPTRRLEHARVSAVNHETTLDVDLVEGRTDRACPRAGVLAMDLLRSCTLALGHSPRPGVRARCVSP